VASPNQTTTYTVTGTGVNGCTAAASATVTVVPLPSLTVNPPAPVRCANGAGVSLTVSGGSQYLWQPATGLNTTTGQTVVATPSQTTTYTVRNTTPGCESQTTVTVTVHAAPQVTVTPSPAEVCPGESVVITASGTATSYLWSPPEGLNTTVGPTVAASPSQSMVYTLTAVAHGCTTTREVPVNVKAPVNLTAAAESWGICRGEATNVTVVGAQSYAWHPPGGVTQIGAGLYRLSPQTTTVYTLMGTTAGCTAQTTITITVEEPVTVTATAPPQPICPGTAATLQATGNGAQYVWSPPTGLNATTGATVTASPTQTTTYTVRAYSLGGFCVSAAATTVQVVPTPAIVPSIPPPTLCAGESVTVALTGAAQYEWNPSLEGGAAQGNNTFVLSPAQTTVYTISGISSNGCPVRLEYAVRVNPLPEVTVTAERTSLCRGESIRLEATGAVMYEWYPGGEVHSGPYRTVKPQETQTYTVVGTDANGCRDTTQITITVAPRPRITAMPPEAVCEGETARIAATGASVYRILPDGAEGDTAVFHPERSGFYRLEGTNEYGCKDTVSVYVRVNALPQLTIKPAEAKICAGETLVLTASGAVRYAWKDETGEGLGEGDTLIFAPPRTQTIILEGTDANGCPNVKLTTITVLGLPEAYEFPDTAVCRGESVRIQPHSHADILFRVFSMPTGGRSLTSELVRHWDTPPVEIQRTYWLETVKDGCVSAYRTPVTVTPLPRPFVPDLPVQTVCKGKELTLSLPDTLHYLWVLPEVGDVHRGPTLHFRADSTTTFYVYSDNGTCNGWRPAKVRIVVYPEPGLVIAAAPDTLYAGEPVTFTAYADTNVIGFLWEVNGKNYYGNPMTFVFPDSGGFDLKLTAYTTEGCVYIFTKNVGVREPNVIPGFPDAFTPNGDGINDVYELKFRNAPRRFEMRIFDRWGMQVAYSTNPERIWDGMHPSGIPVPEGVYAFTLRLEMPNGIVVAKRGTITLLR
jgi:gliding motility-associated-like protein